MMCPHFLSQNSGCTFFSAHALVIYQSSCIPTRVQWLHLISVPLVPHPDCLPLVFLSWFCGAACRFLVFSLVLWCRVALFFLVCPRAVFLVLLLGLSVFFCVFRVFPCCPCVFLPFAAVSCLVGLHSLGVLSWYHPVVSPVPNSFAVTALRPFFFRFGSVY